VPTRSPTVETTAALCVLDDGINDSGAFPRDATVSMVAEAYQGEVAFQMYDATRGDRSIRVVEQLTVRDGQIISSNFVADMAAFAAFTGAGAPDEAEDHQ
jgi:hypothetical protein